MTETQIVPAAPEKKLAPDGDRYQKAVQFVKFITKLDRGEQAKLRRNVGKDLAESRNISWFFRVLNEFNIPVRQEDLYLTFASLLCHDKRAMRDGAVFSGDLSASLALLARKGSPEAVERRLRILLDTDSPGEADDFRFAQVIRLLISKDIPIDWPRLLIDLCDWTKETRPVQKRWARNYYNQIQKNANSEKE